MLTKPRKGKTLKLGRCIAYANWSKAWDGWGRTVLNGRATVWMPLSLELFKADFAKGVNIFIWRLVLRFGITPRSNHEA